MGHASPSTTSRYDRRGEGRFVDACIDARRDDYLRGLPLVGNIDQIVDSADILSTPIARDD